MIYDDDAYLVQYRDVILERNRAVLRKKMELAGDGELKDAVNNHIFYRLHIDNGFWVFREWAPNATAIYLVGDFTNWEKREEFALKSTGKGNWELRVPQEKIKHKDLYKWIVEWEGGEDERLPAYATRCVQDPETKIFSAQVWAPERPYKWKYKFETEAQYPLIYEAHIGMSSEEEKIATFKEFRENVLPKIKELGYTVVQLMAIQEHPYYGSFGYQVSNFFALSSKYGTPEEFKELVDTAHSMGISVIMDLIHSHSVDNLKEGLSLFDGTDYIYFHTGPRGWHPAWKTRCFDYGKDATLHFLLSNCKYWLEEYNLDGFRFDGVTSMIYKDHGINRDFSSYEDYYDGKQDVDALIYLSLANMLIKEVNPRAITIAEDMSGMPGLATPIENGGFGFDFRLSMGIPDNWIKWIKENPDEKWNVGHIYYELTNRRADEKTISYAESHDQALVGDKTIIFRLMDKEMYYDMNVGSNNYIIDRGIALHKMIRLMTISTADHGYLSFMGNEFGHPEWIDFPREGNNWSYFYARRQWSLAENPQLRYKSLRDFDMDMIHLFRENSILEDKIYPHCEDYLNKILAFGRGRYVFVFNLNPKDSYTDYPISVPGGKYKIVLDSDAVKYNGFGRNDENMERYTIYRSGLNMLLLYLPARTAFVLKRID